MQFSKDFLWGTATASYQLEGGALEEGRGECIWYRFSHTPDKIYNGDTGDIACDHLHLYKDDVGLMRDLGLQAYRFSIAWARVLPEGLGATNPQGLDFYDKLVDELLKSNIRPFITLYHWDLPQALQNKGGWSHPDSVKWFAEYTDLMTKRLGDRVMDWITFNEPWCVAFLGNMMGVHAPGNQDAPLAYRVAHHLMLAHGETVPLIRQNVANANVGITLNFTPAYPASDDPKDAEAAHIFDGYFNRWFLDPVFKGVYPADMVKYLGSTLDNVDLAEVKKAAVLIDFLGVNYYTRGLFKWDMYSPFNAKELKPEHAEYTDMNWEVYPQGLTDILVRIHQEYGPKVMYITENGAAYPEPEPENGVVEDPRRVAYLLQHFEAISRAKEQGVPVQGYFVWSFMDNFEWAEGYRKRFGIVYVNYATQERILKRSAHFYKEFIQRHTVS